jgi:hypothetical protein
MFAETGLGLTHRPTQVHEAETELDGRMSWTSVGLYVGMTIVVAWRLCEPEEVMRLVALGVNRSSTLQQ